jgi:hypothetical protein
MNKIDDLLIPLKCDFCNKEAIWFSSPLLNPDEPKLCDDCYNKMKAKGEI